MGDEEKENVAIDPLATGKGTRRDHHSHSVLTMRGKTKTKLMDVTCSVMSDQRASQRGHHSPHVENVCRRADNMDQNDPFANIELKVGPKISMSPSANDHAKRLLHCSCDELRADITRMKEVSLFIPVVPYAKFSFIA